MLANDVLNQFVGKQLTANGRVELKSRGRSMYPFMKEGDRCVMEMTHAPFQIGEVYLYRDEAGRLVAHRLVRLKNNQCIFLGDANAGSDPAVASDRIMARLVRVKRNRFWPMNDSIWKWLVLHMPFFRVLIRRYAAHKK